MSAIDLDVGLNNYLYNNVWSKYKDVNQKQCEMRESIDFNFSQANGIIFLLITCKFKVCLDIYVLRR